MGKGNVTNTPGITEIPGARRHRQTLRQRLLLSSATESPQRGGGTRRQRRAAKAKGGIDFARLALRSVIGVALSTLFAGAAYANPLEGTVTAGLGDHPVGDPEVDGDPAVHRQGHHQLEVLQHRRR
ncbi:hypothetical protein [Azospirillum brasilense]|uniref:hypothetical protein n=1 Tax=Azospirillum brasilense TaxID=192 RepID=UPI0007057C16|nr:hypothetical protein [Azospirillum brasilense]ALJ38136.1 hypothetical protein AMK58_21660 [Azospirillum brasilense]